MKKKLLITLMLGVLSSVSFGMDIDKECKGDPICYKAYKDVNNFAVSKDTDLDFKSFLFFCATGQDKKGHYERYKSFMKKLSNSDNPFQLLDSITYPSEYGTPINNENDVMRCSDAYQTIKANYWQKYRTHEAMAKFVNDTLSSHGISASNHGIDNTCKGDPICNGGIDYIGLPPVNFPTEEAVEFAIELAMESYQDMGEVKHKEKPSKDLKKYLIHIEPPNIDVSGGGFDPAVHFPTEEELVAFAQKISLTPSDILRQQLPKLSADLQQLAKLLSDSDIDLKSSEPLTNIKEKK